MNKIAVLFVIIGFAISIDAQAQRPRRRAVDTLKVSCFIKGASEVAPAKEAFDMRTEDIRLILQNKTDSVVRAGASGRVTTLQRADDGTWEVVFNHGDYWFWISGIQKPAVKRLQDVKPHDPIGYINPGDRIEIRLYDFETPIDVKTFMTCTE